MINYKTESILFILQVLFLILFSFILKDILAAVIVSFFSRPLSKKFIHIFQEHKKEKELAKYKD